MPAYRVYTVGLDGRAADIEVIDAATDADAMTAARKLLNNRDLEIWTGSRRVGKLEAKRLP